MLADMWWDGFIVMAKTTVSRRFSKKWEFL
jgi:hypothetical protein